MRSPDHPVDRDLDVADLRRQPPTGSVKRGHGNPRGRRGLRRYLVSFMVALVLVLFSAVVWFAYQDLMPGGDSVPPLIRADAGELKRDPDERGGLPVVNEESAVVQALDEPESPVRVERIVPRESTAPRSTADVIPEVLEAEPAATAVEGASLAREDVAQVGEPLAADVGANSGGEAVGTETIDTLLAEIIERPEDLAAIEPGAGPLGEDDTGEAERVPLPADGMVLPGEIAAEPSPAEKTGAVAAREAPAMGTVGTTTPAAPAPATEPVIAAAPPAPSAAPAAAPPPPSVVPTGPATTAGAMTAPASPRPAPAAPPPAPTASPAPTPAPTVVAALPSPVLAPTFSGAFRVQLLAVRDEAAAAGAWAGLQQRFPSALGPLRSQVQRAEIGGGTFFRLHAGPFADRSGAAAVCQSLQAQGADCFVVAPTS